MPEPLWLVRPRPDGGCDYVSFQLQPAVEASTCNVVEMREGSHLPPQMPLLKRRHRLDLAEAERCRLQLQQEGGFRCSEPLF
ncbi:MAG: hypothetical protein VKM34_11345 [Cyanobacteriota bacterium]|jgi:hypothetical protein|nr:hypothetical protein [Cyanobacteriota bacterium]